MDTNQRCYTYQLNVLQWKVRLAIIEYNPLLASQLGVYLLAIFNLYSYTIKKDIIELIVIHSKKSEAQICNTNG